MSHASTSTLTRPEGADTSDYAIIHHAIRSAGHALADAAGSLTIADRPRLQAFMKYWRGHTGEILSHHGIEDTIFFPALRAAVAADGRRARPARPRAPPPRPADGGRRGRARPRRRRCRADRRRRRPAPAGRADGRPPRPRGSRDRAAVRRAVHGRRVRGADEGGDQADRDQQAGRLHRAVHRLLGDAARSASCCSPRRRCRSASSTTPPVAATASSPRWRSGAAGR